MTDHWRFTDAQEDMLWTLKEGQTIHKTQNIRLALLTREEVQEMQTAGGHPIENQDHFFHAVVHALRNTSRRKLMALDRQQHMIVGSVTLADRYGDGKIYYGLDVLPEHRNKKYGQEITKATIEYVSKDYRDLIDRLHLVVAVSNAPAIHIYEKAGFAVIQTGTDTSPDGISHEVHVMERLLP
ncbi:GNAT family N-acetyltransferase [Candidatus Peribacteria bacterium]|nr:MAG: GNAT family N-acetyltransferase [Candidatus Peribacteria bacterium]